MAERPTEETPTNFAGNTGPDGTISGTSLWAVDGEGHLMSKSADPEHSGVVDESDTKLGSLNTPSTATHGYETSGGAGDVSRGAGDMGRGTSETYVERDTAPKIVSDSADYNQDRVVDTGPTTTTTGGMTGTTGSTEDYGAYERAGRGLTATDGELENKFTTYDLNDPNPQQTEEKKEEIRRIEALKANEYGLRPEEQAKQKKSFLEKIGLKKGNSEQEKESDRLVETGHPYSQQPATERPDWNSVKQEENIGDPDLARTSS